MQSKIINTYKIEIYGRVQGVGFRPFIYSLAQQFSMVGSVSNNENGVLIYINSQEKSAFQFLEKIQSNRPIVSKIVSTSITTVKPICFEDFKIIQSTQNQPLDIPLTPDFAICNSCKSEIKNPQNRRYKYAFTTCVHCGPRYAVTTNYPFERHNTTLSDFNMCVNCNTEYNDPSDKRFHSQTNSCSNCGIQLMLVDCKGTKVKHTIGDIYIKMAELILLGNIIAIKNTSGYLLCCDASNIEAIQRLRVKKNRANKPFAILYPNIDSISKEFDLTSVEKNQLQATEAPIVVVQNTKETSIASSVISPQINQTGVMLPSSALLQLLMNEVQRPIVATSGNIHSCPIISDDKLAQRKLSNIADFFLHHDLNIEYPQDDSVVKFVKDQPIILRRSRGMTPSYLEHSITSKSTILAMGAHLKSTVTLLYNGQLYTSQYFGNLDSYEVVERYQNTINKYLQLFKTKPKVVLVDSHKQYQSTISGIELAENHNVQLVYISHHRAHFASVLGEHELFDSEEKILGVVWDGTGLGDDGQIWGGEFFTYANYKMERIAHFEYFDWFANDKMPKEPRLSLLSLLDTDDREMIKFKFSDVEWKTYNKVLLDNKLKTSSVGRLFDSVASLLDIIDQNSYEAESGILLENIAAQYQGKEYTDFLQNEELFSSKKLIKNILHAKLNGGSKQYIAASFIYTLANSIIRLAKKENISTIACSGGVFQNSVLVAMLLKIAKNKELDLKFNRKLSMNDENISFGQLMYYENIEK